MVPLNVLKYKGNHWFKPTKEICLNLLLFPHSPLPTHLWWWWWWRRQRQWWRWYWNEIVRCMYKLNAPSVSPTNKKSYMCGFFCFSFINWVNEFKNTTNQFLELKYTKKDNKKIFFKFMSIHYLYVSSGTNTEGLKTHTNRQTAIYRHSHAHINAPIHIYT